MEEILKDDVTITIKIESKSCGAVEDKVEYKGLIHEQIEKSWIPDVENMVKGIARKVWKRFLMVRADVEREIAEKKARKIIDKVKSEEE